MRAAFHFNPNLFGGVYGWPITEILFRALQQIPAHRRHLLLRKGDLLPEEVVGSASEIPTVVERLLGAERAIWRTVSADWLVKNFTFVRPYVLVVDGLGRQDAALTDSRLRQHESYIGAIEAHGAIGLHWALYLALLVPAYRVVGDELRILHVSSDLDPEGRDEGAMRHWVERGLFHSVEWEDTGITGTLLDGRDTPQDAARRDELQDLIAIQLEMVTNEILLRTAPLDPRLQDALYASLDCFNTYHSSEELAQIALSCRRFFAILADAVYPARKGAGRGTGSRRRQVSEPSLAFRGREPTRDRSTSCSSYPD